MDHPFIEALKQKDEAKALRALESDPALIADHPDVIKGFVIACMHNLRDVVEALLTKGADINAPNTGGVTPLMASATCAQDQMLEFLLSKGADPNVQGFDNRTALIWAAFSGVENREAILNNIRHLLKAGANPKLKTTKGYTAVGTAKLNGNQDALELLLSLCEEQRNTP